MQKENCIYIGQVARLHGFKGEVSLFLDVTDPSDYLQMEIFVLDIDACLTPFIVEYIKPKNKGFIMVKFKGIDDERSAQRLLKKNIYLPDTVLPELGNTSFYDHEVVGYAVHDVSFGPIGDLVEVLDHSANPLLQIDKDGIEVLVPIFDGLIVEVKRKEKILIIKAPEGLIELYLS